MREKLIALLSMLTKAVPPPPGMSHSITYQRVGNRRQWEDRLSLNAWHNGKSHTFYLEDKDLDDDPKNIVAVILLMLDVKPDKAAEVIHRPIWSNLTTRQQMIAELVMAGKSNPEIADVIGTTEQVVKNYMRTMFDKVGAESRLHLAVLLQDEIQRARDGKQQ